MNKKGITLIALVITVIVLLILAGIAVAIGLGEEGLFGRTNNAADKWNIRVAEEEGQLNELMDILLPDTTLPTAPTEIEVSNIKATHFTVEAKGATDNKKIEGYKYSIDNGETWSDTNTEPYIVEGLVMETEYEILAKSIDSSGNQSEETKSLKVSTTNEYDGNIGKYVHYPVDLNIDGNFDGDGEGAINGVDDDWRILYEESGMTYLIAADYVPKELVPTVGTGLTRYTDTESDIRPYSVYWINSSALTKASIATETAEKFKLTWKTEYEAKKDSQGNPRTRIILKDKQKETAHLLDSNDWSDFARTDIDINIEAVGAPTIDLWVKSWNERGYTKLYCPYEDEDENNNSGYHLGTSPNTTSWEANCDYRFMLRTGYAYRNINKLYFPHESKYQNCIGYYLAGHPSSISQGGQRVFGVQSAYGLIQSTGAVKTGLFAVRPVVSIPSSIIGASAESGQPIYFLNTTD
ncbi:MAG: fibronectin type III domain-containing protein [Clostridia bacterium]|nr:fibronectin type III domain-containing protein [Clostridia bacterium]